MFAGLFRIVDWVRILSFSHIVRLMSSIWDPYTKVYSVHQSEAAISTSASRTNFSRICEVYFTTLASIVQHHHEHHQPRDLVSAPFRRHVRGSRSKVWETRDSDKIAARAKNRCGSALDFTILRKFSSRQMTSCLTVRSTFLALDPKSLLYRSWESPNRKGLAQFDHHGMKYRLRKFVRYTSPVKYTSHR